MLRYSWDREKLETLIQRAVKNALVEAYKEIQEINNENYKKIATNNWNTPQ